MATAEVLRPRDCLIQRIRVPPTTTAAYHRRKTAPSSNGNPGSSICNYNYPNPNPNPNPRNSRRSNGQKRSSSVDMTPAPATEKVTILRRGESLDSKVRSEVGDVYAGSAFAVVSPSPSSLPLPSFSKKKAAPAGSYSVDDSATRDLRRLLRIG